MHLSDSIGMLWPCPSQMSSTLRVINPQINCIFKLGCVEMRNIDMLPALCELVIQSDKMLDGRNREGGTTRLQTVV